MIILSLQSCDLLSETIRVKHGLADISSGLYSSSRSLFAEVDDGFGVGDEVRLEGEFGGSVEDGDWKLFNIFLICYSSKPFLDELLNVITIQNSKNKIHISNVFMFIYSNSRFTSLISGNFLFIRKSKIFLFRRITTILSIDPYLFI